MNVGCVPSKALLRAGELYWAAGHHPFAGIETSVDEVDLAALVRQKDELVAALRQEKYADLVDAYGFEVLAGRARFVGSETVEVDGRPIRAGAVLVATGASPAIPPIPGLAEAGYLTSTTALNLKEAPGRLAMIGANAIGLELGQFFVHLGSEVTFLDVAARIAPFEEPEVSEVLAVVLRGQGATVLAPAAITAVERDGDVRGLRATVEGAEVFVEVDQVLVATGRRPNASDLGLDAAGIEVDGRGAIVVDEQRVLLQEGLAPAPRPMASTWRQLLRSQVKGILIFGRRHLDSVLRRRSRTTTTDIAPIGAFASPRLARTGHRPQLVLDTLLDESSGPTGFLG